MKIVEEVTKIVKPIVEELGYELYDVEYKKEGTDYFLDIIIDKEEGIDLTDCEKVTRAIDEPIDIADPIDIPYCLCVSSPGADRELKKESDYVRNVDKEIDIRLYKAFEGHKKFVGVLKSYDEESITVMVKNKQITIPREIISVLKQYVSFN